MPQDEEQVRLRQSWILSLTPLLVVLPALIGQVTYHLHPSRYRDSVPGTQFFWVFLLIMCLGVWSTRWFGITLAPTEALVHNLHRRSIPWARVQAVSHEWFIGSQRVVLWTDDGRRVPLRAPMTWFARLGGRRFDRDLHRIGQWWLDHRGPDWRPIPPEFRR